jgi:hypothetical protein
MGPLTTTTLRRAAAATAAILGLCLAALPLTVSHSSLLVDALAVAGIVALTLTLAVGQLALLPVTVFLYASELVVAHNDHSIPTWTIPLLAALLILLHDTADVHRDLPHDATIEPRAIRALIRRLALTAALAAVAATLALAAHETATGGGLTAAVVGVLAITTLLLLSLQLASRRTRAPSGARERGPSSLARHARTHAREG